MSQPTQTLDKSWRRTFEQRSEGRKARSQARRSLAVLLTRNIPSAPANARQPAEPTNWN